MSDPLLDAIRAAPEDDTPRLVWADREGGQVGELVVVQCALAASKRPSREELRRLYAREAELLEKVPGVWERGFAVRVPLHFGEIEADPRLETWPLAHTVDFADARIYGNGDTYPDPRPMLGRIVDVFQRLPSRITGFGAVPSIELGLEAYVRSSGYADALLRALGATDRGRAVERLHVPIRLDDFASLRAFTKLRALTIQHAPAALEDVLGANPSIVDLDLGTADRDGLAVLAEAPLRLARLELRYAQAERGLKRILFESRGLAGLTQLTHTEFDDEWAEALAAAPFARNLRELRIRGKLTERTTEVLLALPALERLAIRSSHGRPPGIERLREAIPYVKL